MAVDIYTVGHSNLPIERFLGVIGPHGITLVVDVRSYPYSRFAPWANAHDLPAALREAGIGYQFFGAALGGRPRNPALWTADGTPDYDRMAGEPAYVQGIEEVLDAARRGTVALLCSEADPRRCHRERLLGVSLRERGCTVKHILSDGGLLASATLFEAVAAYGGDQSGSDVHGSDDEHLCWTA